MKTKDEIATGVLLAWIPFEGKGRTCNFEVGSFVI